MIEKELSIFIAEDEAIILRSFMNNVQRMGYKIAGTALNGTDAAKKIEELNPDLVLMDINMPGKDGLTVIKESCEPRMIPAIIISGHYSEELVEKAKRKCVFAYLIKPIDYRQLEVTINVAWNKYEQYIGTSDEAKHLRETLSNRILVERAKGILMDNFGLKESEAMLRLQKMSKDKNQKLVKVAKEIIDRAKLLDI